MGARLSRAIDSSVSRIISDCLSLLVTLRRFDDISDSGTSAGGRAAICSSPIKPRIASRPRLVPAWLERERITGARSSDCTKCFGIRLPSLSALSVTAARRRAFKRQKACLEECWNVINPGMCRLATIVNGKRKHKARNRA